MIHHLKIEPEHFQDVWDGRKTHEVRSEAYRCFYEYDQLHLMEWAPTDWDAPGLPGKFTGRQMTVDVLHVLRDPGCRWLQPNMAVLSIQKRDDDRLPPLDREVDTVRGQTQDVEAKDWKPRPCEDDEEEGELTMTLQDLDELERRYRASTPGLWYIWDRSDLFSDQIGPLLELRDMQADQEPGDDELPCDKRYVPIVKHAEDARWIAYIHNTLPKILQVLRKSVPDENNDNGENVRKDLVRLREATNEALQWAPNHVMGAINWANLHCVEARHFRSDDGSTGYEVLIEEASPDSWALQNFVGGHLAQAGFANVEVMTEW